MANLAAVFNFATTMFAFIEGIVEQVAPLVNRFLEKRVTPPPQPIINPNCQLPRCGEPPYFCPEEQLSQMCIQRKMLVEKNNMLRRTTLASNTDDDNNENKEKSSHTSMSPSTTIMLVFVFVMILAIIGFLFIRFKQSNTNRQSYSDRRSSTWSV